MMQEISDTLDREMDEWAMEIAGDAARDDDESTLVGNDDEEWAEWWMAGEAGDDVRRASREMRLTAEQHEEFTMRVRDYLVGAFNPARHGRAAKRN